jgi:hypothetical protein
MRFPMRSPRTERERWGVDGDRSISECGMRIAECANPFLGALSDVGSAAAGAFSLRSVGAGSLSAERVTGGSLGACRNYREAVTDLSPGWSGAEPWVTHKKEWRSERAQDWTSSFIGRRHTKDRFPQCDGFVRSLQSGTY